MSMTDVDLVADHAPAPWQLVLPGDPELVAVDPGPSLEAEAAHRAAVLIADPERGGVPGSQSPCGRARRSRPSSVTSGWPNDERDLVDVAPGPVLAGLQRADDRVVAGRGVL